MTLKDLSLTLGLEALDVKGQSATTPNRAAGCERTADGYINASPIDPPIPAGAGAPVATTHDLVEHADVQRVSTAAADGVVGGVILRQNGQDNVGKRISGEPSP